MSVHQLPIQLHSAPFETLDPGTGQAIRVERFNQVIPLTIAASTSETNTLAAPLKAGQRVTLFAASVGSSGTRTVTVASAIDALGTTSIVFAAVDDRITLESVPVGSGVYEWRVVANEGAAGPQLANADDVGITDGGSFTATTTVEDALAEIYQHLKSTQIVVPLNLQSWREVDANGDVGTTAVGGGTLASNTTPVLRSGSTECFEIFYAANDVDPIQQSISLPEDLDDTKDAFVDIFCQANTTDQAPSFVVGQSWQAGTQVTDSATAVTSTSIQTITATIASGDIPAGVTFVSLQLTPAAHATSSFLLHGARLRYQGVLRTS